MNIEVFSVRTAGGSLQSDQKKLNDFINSVQFSKSEAHFVESDEYWSVMIYYEPKTVPKQPKEAEVITSLQESDLTPGGLYVLECLKAWRTDQANALQLPKFMICHNVDLLQIAYHLPKDVEALGRIKGFGEKKVARYGEAIISVLNTI